MAKPTHNAFLNEAIPGLAFTPSSSITETPFAEGQLRFEAFLEISKEYKDEYGHSLVYCDNQGNLVFGIPECKNFPCSKNCTEFRRAVLEEALNSGSPDVHACGDSCGLWGVPVMLNNTANGGLIIVGAEHAMQFDSKSEKDSALSEACQGLLSLAVKYNIVNLAFLEHRKEQLMRSEKFTPPLHIDNDQVVSKLQDFLCDREPELLENIRNREIEAAREKLGEILQFIAELPQDYLSLAKGVVLDLLVSMDHASMEAGNNFVTLMRFNCSLSLEIHRCDNPQELSEILRQGLDETANIISPYHKRKNDVVLKNILSYLERNFHRNLSRESIADRFGVSVSHLSHLLSQKMGRTFVEILNQYRVDRAAQLLVMTELTLIEITLECGFQDQSYFGKVFRRHYGLSPARYRSEKTGPEKRE